MNLSFFKHFFIILLVVFSLGASADVITTTQDIAPTIGCDDGVWEKEIITSESNSCTPWTQWYKKGDRENQLSLYPQADGDQQIVTGELREVQEWLKAQGWYMGPIDGIFGILTKRAVEVYHQTYPVIINKWRDTDHPNYVNHTSPTGNWKNMSVSVANYLRGCPTDTILDESKKLFDPSTLVDEGIEQGVAMSDGNQVTKYIWECKESKKLSTSTQRRSSLGTGTSTPVVTCDAAMLPYGGGTGTGADPYLVCTPDHFQNIEQNLDATYEVTQDIDFNAYALSPIGIGLEVFDPQTGSGYYEINRLANTSTVTYQTVEQFVIGDTLYVQSPGDGTPTYLPNTVTVTASGPGTFAFADVGADGAVTGDVHYMSKPFTGTLDGGSFELQNIDMRLQNYDASALFPFVVGGEIRDLTLTNVYSEHRIDDQTSRNGGAAVLVAYGHNDIISGDDFILDNVHISGGQFRVIKSAGAEDELGLASKGPLLAEGRVKATDVSVDLTMNIVDDAGTGSVDSGYNGMLFGLLEQSTVNGCYATGQMNSIIGATHYGEFGGVVGRIDAITLDIDRCHSDTDLNISSATAAGANQPAWWAYARIGGFVGYWEHRATNNGSATNDVLVTGDMNITTLASNSLGGYVGTFRGSPAVGTDDFTDVLVAPQFNVVPASGLTDRGFVGQDFAAGVATETFFNSTSTGMTTGASTGFSASLTPQTTAQFNTVATFSASLSPTIWNHTAGSYPCLIGVTPSC